MQALVATPTLPLLFGAAGVGLGSYKAHRLTEGIGEFCFVPIPAQKCDEEGFNLTEDEKDVSEPWTIDWKTQSVSCDKPLEENPEKLMEFASISEIPPNSSTQQPLGAPPPVNRSTKGAAPPSERVLNASEPLELPSVPQIPPRLPPRGRESPKESPPVLRSGASASSPMLKRAGGALIALRNSGESLRKGVNSFEIRDYKPKVDHSHSGMRVCICVNGWVWNKQEFTSNWVALREIDPSMDCFGLRWESEELQSLGRCLVTLVTQTVALQIAKLWIISASAVAAGLVSALAWPFAGL